MLASVLSAPMSVKASVSLWASSTTALAASPVGLYLQYSNSNSNSNSKINSNSNSNSTVGAKIIARPKLSRGVFTDAVALKLWIDLNFFSMVLINGTKGYLKTL